MNAFRTLHRSVLLLFAIVVVAIVTLVHFSVSTIVAEQSRAQQQSLSPAFSLIVEQLIKPLHTAEVLSKSPELVDLMDAETIDPQQIHSMLNRLGEDFDLAFFIASEKARMQYNSDGPDIPLIKNKVNWYFKYKALDKPAVTDIGKWENTHFYIDIKIFNDDGEFLGFFGVGKSLKSFVSVFESYKLQYGYDFLFVNDVGDIMLSSDADLMAESSDFTNLSELPWFATLPDDVKDQRNLNNRLVTINQQEYLVAEVKLNQFDWTVFLLSPLDKRKADISHAFVISVVTLLVVVFSLFMMIYHLLHYFRRDLSPEAAGRSVNRLLDQNRIEKQFDDFLAAHHSVSMVLVGIDNFASINDTYGRNTGDNVLDSIAAYLFADKRNKDVLGRWSSEEFVILLPDTGPHEAVDIAQNLRHGIATLAGPSNHPQLQLTGSFGISFTASPRPMSEVAANAEDALYQARRDGNNLVKMQLIE
ncbi:diguanylate cyclase [Alteromonas pelagimontana]|uniref:diguanylate cyclase n=1 Tax=Alteromonas pelagimontana TaxID=1858656 RepID=A0A6M4MDQ0_9ALTE|nr:diguanylate cyclase [Alteromonas pelagimontana]QJR80750.1 diguanylate cyclase [Alteromonas pelagimontana]